MTNALVPWEYTEAMHKALVSDEGFPLIQWGNAIGASPNAGKVSREKVDTIMFELRSLAFTSNPTTEAVNGTLDRILSVLGLEIEESE